VNILFQKILGVFNGWIGDGPWRSKSVLAVLAVALIGLGSWCSDTKNGPPQDASTIEMTNAPGVTHTGTAVTPAAPHWNWSKPFPVYVRLTASYVAGFGIGWFIRKLTRLIFVVTALAIALLAYGKLAGCDTTRTQEQVQHGSEWAQHEATTARDYLMHLLPSATGGGIGIFRGLRRRGKAVTPEATPEPADKPAE
jgi:uncharacterized membrane protein (Fun14 family)